MPKSTNESEGCIGNLFGAVIDLVALLFSIIVLLAKKLHRIKIPLPGGKHQISALVIVLVVCVIGVLSIVVYSVITSNTGSTNLQQEQPVLASTPIPVYSKPTNAPIAPSTKVCCKYCSTGKPCGDSCIAKNKTCTQPAGCACP